MGACTSSANTDVSVNKPNELSKDESNLQLVVVDAASTDAAKQDIETVAQYVEVGSSELPDHNQSLPVVAEVEQSKELFAEVESAVPVSSSETVPITQMSTVPPLKKGFILKEGHLIKSWKNRFFVLENGVMTYYESSIDKPPYGAGKKGEMSLKDTTAIVDKNIITITYNGDGASREGKSKLTLEIRYPTEKEEWLQAINSHIAYCSSTAAAK